jgi:hypothetical protein
MPVAPVPEALRVFASVVFPVDEPLVAEIVETFAAMSFPCEVLGFPLVVVGPYVTPEVV